MRWISIGGACRIGLPVVDGRLRADTGRSVSRFSLLQRNKQGTLCVSAEYCQRNVSRGEEAKVANSSPLHEKAFPLLTKSVHCPADSLRQNCARLVVANANAKAAACSKRGMDVDGRGVMMLVCIIRSGAVQLSTTSSRAQRSCSENALLSLIAGQCERGRRSVAVCQRCPVCCLHNHSG